MTLKAAPRLVLLVFVLLSATSCSSLKMGWSYFESLSMYYLDDYINLPSKEKRDLKEKIATLKKDQLIKQVPLAIEQLDAWNLAIGGEALTKEQAEALIKDTQKISAPIFERVATESSSVLLGMTESQKNHLVGQINKRLEKRENLSEKEIEKKIQKRFRSNMDRFFGGVDESQKQILSAQQKITEEEHKASTICQREIFNSFKVKLKSEAAELSQFINAYFTDPEKINSEACSQVFRARESRWSQTLVELHPTLSNKQKKHFQTQVAQWQGDLRSIYQKEIAVP